MHGQNMAEANGPETVTTRSALEEAWDEHVGDDEEEILEVSEYKKTKGVDETPSSSSKEDEEPKVLDSHGAEDDTPDQDEDSDESEDETKDLPPPQFWRGEHRQLWAKTPKEVKAAIHEYEANRTRWVNGLSEQIAGQRKQYEKFDELFEPHQQRLKMSGLTKADAVARLLAWQEAYDDPKTRRDTFLKHLSTYGMNVEDLLNGDGESAGQAVSNSYNPQLEELQRKYDQLESQLREREQGAVLQTAAAEVEAFKSARDADGNLLRPYVDMFEPQIAEIAKQLKQQYPQGSASQILETAYNYVMDQVNTNLVEPKLQRTTAEQVQKLKAETQKKRDATSSLRPTPGAQTKEQKPISTRDALAQAWAEHMG